MNIDLAKYFRDIVAVAQLSNMKYTFNGTYICEAIEIRGIARSDSDRVSWQVIFAPHNITFFSTGKSEMKMLTSHDLSPSIVKDRIFDAVSGANRNIGLVRVRRIQLSIELHQGQYTIKR